MRRLLTLLFLTTILCTIQAQQQLPMQLWYDKPALYFEESLPIGNGKLGALVYGGTDSCLIHLNDITFWTGKPVDQNEGKGAAQWIPEIRKAVEGHNSEFYQPLATMYLVDMNKGNVTDYYRELDIDSAICSDRYTRNGQTITREFFASHPDKLIAIRLKGDVNCKIVMTAQVPHQVKSSNNQLTMTGHATGDANETIHFCTMLQVKTDGEVSTADSTLTIANAQEAVIYLVNETSFNGYDKHPVREGAPYIENATDDIWHTQNYSYDEFLTRHITDYQQYYDRVKLNIGGKGTVITTDSLLKQYRSPLPLEGSGVSRYLETLYFQYGRYLLISCSRTKGVPANLQGLWAPQLWSPWRGNYTMNINLEENYWPPRRDGRTAG